MKRPNFFIVGAPKCATSSMYAYLGAHPDIFLSKDKEPHFFGTDITTPRSVRDMDEYLALFNHVKHEKRIGEASVLYLYSERAANEIKAFCPSAKIIIMLRNPIDMMYSWYAERFYVGHEDIQDFESAIEAEIYRKQGLLTPRPSYSINVFFYVEIAKFTNQVRRYFDTFGRENVQVIIFEDLKRDTEKIYKDTLQFLDVDLSFKPEFTIVNANKQPRSNIVQRFLNYPPKVVQTIGKKMIPSYAGRRAIIGKLRHLNRKHRPRQPMSPDLRQRLLKEFRIEVEQLSNMLDRDLTFWINES